MVEIDGEYLHRKTEKAVTFWFWTHGHETGEVVNLEKGIKPSQCQTVSFRDFHTRHVYSLFYSQPPHQRKKRPIQLICTPAAN